MIRSASVLIAAWLPTLLAGAGGEADGQWMLMGAAPEPQVVAESAVATASLVIRNAKVVYHRNGAD